MVSVWDCLCTLGLWECLGLVLIETQELTLQRCKYRNCFTRIELFLYNCTAVHCVVRQSSVWIYSILASLKPGSQYDACASVAMQTSRWCLNRLDFYSSNASPVSIQPIRLSKMYHHAGLESAWLVKKVFPVKFTTLVTLVAPASLWTSLYCHNVMQCNNIITFNITSYMYM